MSVRMRCFQYVYVAHESGEGKVIKDIIFLMPKDRTFIRVMLFLFIAMGYSPLGRPLKLQNAILPLS